VAKIAVAPNKGTLQLSSIKTLANEGIRAALDKYKATVTISMTSAPALVFQGIKKQSVIMQEMTKFLKYAATFTLTT
jgi:hypothetical protein